MVSSLVHVAAGAADRGPDNKALPLQVTEMRDMILGAVRSGNADDLKAALDWNEVKPDLGFAPDVDQIAALKLASSDGQGRETLAALGEILDMPPAALPLGNDLENNLIYVWPYLAERPLDQLTAAEDVDLYRLVPAAKGAEMREKKRWTWWRAVIGADGSWHLFKKMD